MRTKFKMNHPREAGSIRLMLILLVVGISLLCIGWQRMRTAITNRKPTIMAYSDYARAKPSTAWLTLTNCQLNLARSCYLSYDGDKNEAGQDTYYIPVIDPNSDSREVCVLLKTRNPTFLKTIREMSNVKNDQDAIIWVKQNRERIFPHTDITGLIISGMDLNEHDREELAKTQKNIAEDFVILDEDAQPSFAAGAGCTVGGLASLCGLVVYFRKKQQQ